MKKTFLLFLATVLMLGSFAACGGGEDMAPASEETSEEFITWKRVGDVFTISGTGPMKDLESVYTEDNGTALWRVEKHNAFSVIIEEGITRIGDYAFDGFQYVESLTIPASVTEISPNALARMDRLMEIKVAADNKNYVVENGVLFTADKKTLVKYPVFSSANSYEIPDSVEVISGYAFYGSENLELMQIPNGVITIGDSAFAYCCGENFMPTITIPDSVTTIGEEAFYDCDTAKEINLGNGVISVGDRAFSGCEEVKEINFGNSLTSIGVSSFSDVGVAELNLPSSLKTIGEYAFEYVEVDELVIPDSVTEVGEYAFKNCGLKKLTLGKGLTSLNRAFAFNDLTSLYIPANITNVDGFDFDTCGENADISIDPDNQHYVMKGNVVFTKDMKTLVYYHPSNMKKTYTVPSGVEVIEFYGFNNNNYLETVVLPKSLKKIGVFAFYESRKLKLEYDGSVSSWQQVERTPSSADKIGSDSVKCINGSAYIND